MRRSTAILRRSNVNIHTSFKYIFKCQFYLMRGYTSLPPERILYYNDTLKPLTLAAGYDIPKDTMVLINTWALHNDPAHWPDPARFLPSRFLTPAGELAPAPRSFLPFSAGKRACLGEALAKAELMLVIPLLWQRFSFQPKPGCQLEIELEDSSLINLPKPYDVVAVARA